MPHKLLLADDSVTIQRVIELTFADEDVAGRRGRRRRAGDRAHRSRAARTSSWPTSACRSATATRSRRSSRTTPALAHIPVLLLTGAFEPVDEDARARRSAATACWSSRSSRRWSISRVKELLARHAPAAPLGGRRRRRVADAGAAGVAGGDYLDRLDAAFASDYFERLDAAFARSAQPAGEPDRRRPSRGQPAPSRRRARRAIVDETTRQPPPRSRRRRSAAVAMPSPRCSRRSRAVRFRTARCCPRRGPDAQIDEIARRVSTRAGRRAAASGGARRRRTAGPRGDRAHQARSAS